jgi:hypothetical protein
MFNLNKSILSSALFFLAICPLILTAQETKKDPFKVHSKSAHITSVEIKNKKGTNNNIVIQLTNSNAGGTYSVNPANTGNDASWHQIPPPQITDITVMKGEYSSAQKRPDNARNSITTLLQVQYPLRIKIEISGQNLDVEFLEAGNWNLNVALDNIYNPDILAAPSNR